MPVTKERVEQVLKEKLNPDHLEVEDTSGGCGAMFKVLVVSSAFVGKSLVDRQRLVNEALKEEMKEIHALQQKTMTPEQWQKQQQQQQQQQ